MKKKQLQTKHATIWVIDVPQGVEHIGHSRTGVGVFDGKETVHFLSGSFEVLGKVSQLTETQWEKIVEIGDKDPGGDRYIPGFVDYEIQDTISCLSYDTAKASGESLLRSHNIINPLGTYEENIILGDASDIFKEWQQAEALVWKNPVIILQTKRTTALRGVIKRIRQDGVVIRTLLLSEDENPTIGDWICEDKGSGVDYDINIRKLTSLATTDDFTVCRKIIASHPQLEGTFALSHTTHHTLVEYDINNNKLHIFPLR